MTTNEKAVRQLNKLIQTNLDRKEGYLKAADNTDEPDLKALFLKYSTQSSKYVADLEAAVESYGGIAEDNTSLSGDMFRAWMDIKSAVASDDAKAVLQSCERGEDAALQAYKDVMDDPEDVDNNMLGALASQQSEIQEAHNKIKFLRDNAAG